MAKRTIAGSRGIVTGASSGIGRAIATQLVRQGANVLAVARRADLLQQLAAKSNATGKENELPPPQGRFEILVGDLTDPTTRLAAVKTANQIFGGVDFLVNAAGISSVARFAEGNSERLREIMEVNFFATAELIRAALPALQQGNCPMIVNIGSILGHRGIPWHADYCASKFALQGLSEAIRPELNRLGIDLLVVSPGTTKTELYSADPAKKMLPWPEPKGVMPEYVARSTVRAMAAGRREITPNPQGRLLVLVSRWCPALVDRFMLRYG